MSRIFGPAPEIGHIEMFLITLVETRLLMYFPGIFNNFLNRSDALLSYMM